jgi:hypothetical protein
MKTLVARLASWLKKTEEKAFSRKAAKSAKYKTDDEYGLATESTEGTEKSPIFQQ